LRAWKLFLLVLVGAWPNSQARAQAPDPREEAQKTFASIKWDEGPGKVSIGKESELQLPAGYRFTGPDGTRKMLELMHNPTDGSELGLLTNTDLDWFVIFEFEDSGYVKDADKEKLDPVALLDSIKEGNESANEARAERGWPPIRIVGWHTAPFYNKETNNLEWCIKGESQGRTIVNYNTRILGRGGVTSANLLVDPAALDKVLPETKTLLAGFSYLPGRRYSEWRAGDKVAKYGLTALVVGGAVGAAAKMGLLAKIAAKLGKLWKLIIIGLVSVLAALKKLVFRTKADKAPQPEPAAEPPPTNG
jgi:uncharacterized membrane-anchored protein